MGREADVRWHTFLRPAGFFFAASPIFEEEE